MQDGRLVEVDDSVHFGAGRDERPSYRSDAGRVVYGGGGIMPDLEVESDTLSSADQALLAAILPRSPEFSTTVFDMASELKGQVEPDFVIRPEWRADLYDRLVAKGVELERPVFDAGVAYIDRVLLDLIGRSAFGDAYVKTRDVENDIQLMKAAELIHQGGARQADLFGYVQTVKAGQG
jgi:carboxyl-terminal processing protease